MAKIESFSKKQLKLLTWWYPESRDSGYDAIICDGAVIGCIGFQKFTNKDWNSV